MGIMDAVRSCFQNYANFYGRARRSELWLFSLFNFLISCLSFIPYVVFFVWFYGIVVLVPSLAVSVRRLHDIGKPGSYLLFCLIPFVGWILLLVWFVQDSEPGGNIYGPNPKSGYYHYSPANDQKAAVLPVNYNNVQNVKLYVKGIKGALAGRRFPVNGRMTAGRALECGIVFPQGTAGISRRHFELFYKDGNLYIQDLGSSFGTVIYNNQKLTPYQPAHIKPGAVIFVGSTNQVLTLEQE